MHRYEPANTLDGLVALPPLSRTPGYRVIRGDPRASIRIDREPTEADPVRLGVWACTAGAFECVERGDELQSVLAGRLRLVDAAGREQILGPGDSVFTRKGERVVWDILEDVRKVFFTYLGHS